MQMIYLHEELTHRTIHSKRVAIFERAETNSNCIYPESGTRVLWDHA